MFDISLANADQLIKVEEDRKFLKLQKESRTGVIGSVDIKLFEKEKLSAARNKFKCHTPHKTRIETDNANKSELLVQSGTSDESTNDYIEDLDYRANIKPTGHKRKLKPSTCTPIISPKIASVLDRTNTSIRKSTMILASAVNEAGPSTRSIVLSKSTVHRHRQRRRQEAAKNIMDTYQPFNSVVHWDGKLLPDVTGIAAEVD